MFLVMLILLLIGFVVGALTILAAEAVGVYFIINWLDQKTKKKEAQIASQSQEPLPELDTRESINFACNKKGIVWLLESEKILKNWLDKVPKDQKKKKDFLEVFPVKKHAKIKDKKLFLTELDGSHTTVELKGCIIEAVSASNISSRKWAKRFPIKLESKTSVLYNGSKTLYIYLETSWEKESWCKALRLASCEKKERVDWFSKLHEEFHGYLTTLNAGYPSFMKPSVGFCAEPVDQTNRPDGTSSKFRLLLKKLAKRTARVGLENKPSFTSSSGRVERKASERVRPFQETVAAATGLGKTTLSVTRSKSEENMVQQSSSTFSHSGSQSHISVISDVDSDDKFGNDDGTLCWNLLISRLFFDMKGNAEIKRSVQSRVQRTLSSMRTPSYIGEVICTGIDLGNLPPYIHGMRILPMDMNEVWALEVDIEYSGGMLLDIETRLEVRELDFEKGMVNSDPVSTSDLLEGLEFYGKQLSPVGGTVDVPEQREEDGLKSSKSTVSASTSYGSRWKSILNSISRKVSQVPLSLTIRVTSLRGTLRLHIKPPPSDQLWLAFTSMPDIDFNLESSVGEHRITNGHIAVFLVSRLKAAIRETLVLPNCENVCIPWMMAEKDDWVPKKAAPFMWLNQEANNDPTTGHEVTASQPIEAKTKTEVSSKETSRDPESKHPKPKTEVSKATSRDPESKYPKPENSVSINESPDVLSASTNSVHISGGTLQETRTPSLLRNDEPQETCKQAEEIPESQSSSSSRSMIQYEKQDSTTEDDDLRLKRVGGEEQECLILVRRWVRKLKKRGAILKRRVGTLLRRCEDRETARTKERQLPL